MIVQFPFERRRKGYFIECRWFYIRFYPPSLPRFNFYWKRVR